MSDVAHFEEKTNSPWNLSQVLSLQRELLDAVRQNGDLRVEIERQKARIAELERQLAEALKPQERPPVLGERSAAAG